MNAEAYTAGLEIGLEGMSAWFAYAQELKALQDQRAAEGKSITQEDVNAALAGVNDAVSKARSNG